MVVQKSTNYSSVYFFYYCFIFVVFQYFGKTIMSVFCNNGSVHDIHMKDVFSVLQVEFSVSSPRLLFTELTFFFVNTKKKKSYSILVCD